MLPDGAPATLPLPARRRPLHQAPPPTAPPLPPPTRFSKKQCVWFGLDNAGPETQRADWSHTRPSGPVSAGSERSGVTGVITASYGSEADRPVPRESLGAPCSRQEPHTKFPLWGRGGLGAGSFGHRETQVWGFSEGTTRPLSQLCPIRTGWPPCWVHSVQGPSPSGWPF